LIVSPAEVLPLKNVVSSRRQVHVGPGAVVDLQRLVVAASLDVLAEEQFGPRAARRGWCRQRQQGAEGKCEGEEERGTALHRHRESGGHE
jgi:hypothetical protein